MEKVKEVYMYLLGAFVVGGAFGIVTLLILIDVPPSSKDIVNVSLGTLLSLAVGVVSYFFGSSKSSADKNITAKQMVEAVAQAKVIPMILLFLTLSLGAFAQTGATGPTGPTGPTGVTGATGARGATGATGLVGAKGDRGVIGATGHIGVVGSVGPRGLTGSYKVFPVRKLVEGVTYPLTQNDYFINVDSLQSLNDTTWITLPATRAIGDTYILACRTHTLIVTPNGSDRINYVNAPIAATAGLKWLIWTAGGVGWITN